MDKPRKRTSPREAVRAVNSFESMRIESDRRRGKALRGLLDVFGDSLETPRAGQHDARPRELVVLIASIGLLGPRLGPTELAELLDVTKARARQLEAQARERLTRQRKATAVKPARRRGTELERLRARLARLQAKHDAAGPAASAKARVARNRSRQRLEARIRATEGGAARASK